MGCTLRVDPACSWSSLESRRRRRENREKEEKQTTTSGLYSAARSAQERHAACTPCQREAEGGHGRAWKTGERTPTVGRWCPVANLIFEVFTDLPLSSFYKLLSNLYNNSKISKNKSCSKSKVLQLCLNEHFSNSASILKFEFGVHLSI